MHAKVHSSQEVPSIRIPLRRCWCKLLSLVLELCTVSEYDIWFYRCTIYSPSTFNKWNSPVGEVCIDSLLIIWPFLSFNYTFWSVTDRKWGIGQTLYKCYINIITILYSKTWVGLGIWLCASIYCMPYSFFLSFSRICSHMADFGSVWQCFSL